MDISYLQQIGLTRGEIKIYQALLEIGETTRTKLAKKSGISPSKIYDVTNRLLEKGIVSVVKKNGVLHFSAATPTRLMDFVKLKEDEIQKERGIVSELLPLLIKQHKKTKEAVDVEIFYGWEGMKTVFNDLAMSLTKGDENFIFGASQGLDPDKADRFFSQYYKLVEKRGYSIHVIFNENVRQNKKRMHYLKTKKQHKVRFLYQDTFTELNVYKNTVLIIMMLKEPVIIRITNKDAADSFKKFFKTMWSKARN